MQMHLSNFGLSGYNNYAPGSWDSLLGLGKKARERREEKRAERKQTKEEKRQEKQEKKELANEKRRLKNEMKQVQIDEKKGQLSALNNPGLIPPPTKEASSGEMTAVAVVVGIIFVAGIGWMVMRKKMPLPANAVAKI